jgi:pyruvate dehydrogenase E1 component alpha subunit
MYRRMFLIRRFEEKTGQQYGLGKIGGFCHLYIGQEAVAVGAVMALRDDDYTIDGYRDHGHALARGTPAGAVLAEMFGKLNGVAKGKGGSMHLFDRSRNFLGGYGIVGGQIPLATGVGWAIKYKAEQKVCVCFIGDAAINQGSFHESLNMAAIWKLPVIYIVENNRYGMGTPIELACAVEDLFQRAVAYDIPGEAMDGMDALAVHACVRKHVDQVRAGGGPALLEARTYRFRGHSMSDPATYRTKEEVEEEQRKDPVPRLKLDLIERKVASEGDFSHIEDEVKAEVEEAIKFADQGPEPGPEELYDDVVVPLKRA